MHQADDVCAAADTAIGDPSVVTHDPIITCPRTSPFGLAAMPTWHSMMRAAVTLRRALPDATNGPPMFASVLNCAPRAPKLQRTLGNVFRL